MNLVVIGVNHKTASVALRERLAFAPDALPAAADELNEICDGFVLLSTCNRTEIYAIFTHKQTSPALQQLSRWLSAHKSVSQSELVRHLYHHQGLAAVAHWLRVASGLDSMILGEPQIFGQIKKAVHLAEQTNSLSVTMRWLVDQVFAGAKKIRHDSQVGAQAVSLGFASAKLVTQIFDDPSALTLLVVASGEMNRLIATHISELGVDRIMLCNRSIERAEALAQVLRRPGKRITVHPLNELSKLLPQADVVSSCSGSMQSLIDKKMAKAAIKKRRYRPMLMIDLAVPRDIEPAVGKLDDVYLYSVDDLGYVIEGNRQKRQQAAADAELMVNQYVTEIEQRWQTRQISHDIQLYRHMVQAKAQTLLTESLKQLQNDATDPAQIMAELTHKLTQTLTHPSTRLMRQAASTKDAQTLKLVVDGLLDAYRPKDDN